MAGCEELAARDSIVVGVLFSGARTGVSGGAGKGGRRVDRVATAS
jgi:hypothetical protein